MHPDRRPVRRRRLDVNTDRRDVAHSASVTSMVVSTSTGTGATSWAIPSFIAASSHAFAASAFSTGWERREACPEASLVLAIHDELVAEVPTEKAEAAKAWLEAAMRDGIAPLVAPVPVEVETTIEVTEAE